MLDYEEGTPRIDEKFQIKIVEAGPYLVFGRPPIKEYIQEKGPDGFQWSYREMPRDYALDKGPTALCRCGHSSNAPYCDGTHTRVEWNEKLTALHHAPMKDAVVIEGPTLILTDAERYCSFARFCDARGRTWNQVRASGEEARELAIRTANHCPAGRLKVWDRATGQPIEEHFEPSIAILQDPENNCSGPLWVRGGIPVTDSKGYTYQVRNRVALCRCGNSRNKPFCDGTHVPADYIDGIKR